MSGNADSQVTEHDAAQAKAFTSAFRELRGARPGHGKRLGFQSDSYVGDSGELRSIEGDTKDEAGQKLVSDRAVRRLREDGAKLAEESGDGAYRLDDLTDDQIREGLIDTVLWDEGVERDVLECLAETGDHEARQALARLPEIKCGVCGESNLPCRCDREDEPIDALAIGYQLRNVAERIPPTQARTRAALQEMMQLAARVLRWPKQAVANRHNFVLSLCAIARRHVGGRPVSDPAEAQRVLTAWFLMVTECGEVAQSKVRDAHDDTN